MRFDVLDRVEELGKSVLEDSIRSKILQRTKTEFESKLETTKEELTLAEKSRELLNNLVNDRKRTTIDKIERLVTHGLRTIFENDSYEFKIVVKQVRKQVSYSFELRDEGFKSSEIEYARGGGIINVVSFLLAVVVQLSLDPKARLFILDEKFAHVSSQYLPNVADLLREMSTRMGLQFIQVTHEDELQEAADVFYKIKRDKNGVATVEKQV